MKSTGAKVIVIAAAVAVCIFFGIDLATSGIERVGGPIGGASQPPPVSAPAAADSASVSSASQAASSAASLPGDAASSAVPPASASPASAAAGRPSFINRLSLKLGDVLRALAQWAIRLVTAVFNAIVH